MRLYRSLALRGRDGTLLTTEEAAECRTRLGGVTVPYVEQFPALTFLEAFELELAGRPVWGEILHGDNWPERSTHLFVCLVLDAIYRDCQFVSVTRLWDVMVASEPQLALLFGQHCYLSDVMMIDLVFVKLCIIRIFGTG